MDNGFDIKGLDPVLKKLDVVKQDVRLKGGRFALRKAAQIVRKAAQQNALRHDDADTGRAIASNIAERWNGKLFKATGDIGFRVGVMKGARLPKDNSEDVGVGAPTPHWRLLEFGTDKMPASPMMRPALADNVDRATDEFVSQYDKALDRAIAKATP